MTAEDVEIGKQRLLGNALDENRQRLPTMREYADFYYDNMPVPEKKPNRGRMLVDAKQVLWVQDYALNEDARGWTVFTPIGERLGRMELPPNYRVLEIGTDYVLGVLRDEFDVQTIAIFHIARRLRTLDFPEPTD